MSSIRNSNKPILDETKEEADQRRKDEVEKILQEPRPNSINMRTAGSFRSGSFTLNTSVSVNASDEAQEIESGEKLRSYYNSKQLSRQAKLPDYNAETRKKFWQEVLRSRYDSK